MGVFKKIAANSEHLVVKGKGPLVQPKKPTKVGPGGIRQLIPAGAKLTKVPSMKTGGMVKETALHLLHKGEMVLPASVTQHIHKLIKKAKDIKNIVKS
jgi:hypothetical protein